MSLSAQRRSGPDTFSGETRSATGRQGKSVRIAFLTPEYPSEQPDEGGLATYLHRMAHLLRDAGHEPEIFVLCRGGSETLFHDGIRVHRVGWHHHPRIFRIGLRLSRRLIPSSTWNYSVELLLNAYALSRSLEIRHAAAPFDLVQSSGYRAAGLFVKQRPQRLAVVRCSSAADLYNASDGRSSATERIRAFFERLTIRRARFAYAPSQFIAEYFRATHGIPMAVIRPPIHTRSGENPALTIVPPNRFFIHFGQLTRRKGTDLLAEALPLAWERAPDLTMVWSGKCSDPASLRRWRSLWGARASQVQITGPLPRAQLYTLLGKADAAVLPSQVDNLPNTVIESLCQGIPVLGTRGASIDELVEENRTGHLVGIGDVRALANALADMWLRRSPVAKGFTWQAPICGEMQCDQVVANLLGLRERAA